MENLTNLTNLINDKNKKKFNINVKIKISENLSINGDILIKENIKSHAYNKVEKILKKENKDFEIISIDEIKENNRIIESKKEIKKEKPELLNEDVEVGKTNLLESLRKPYMHCVEDLGNNEISIATDDEYSTVVEIKGIKK